MRGGAGRVSPSSGSRDVCFCGSFRHIGAQLSHSANPTGHGDPDEPVPIVHVKYATLVENVERGRECKRRFVGGVMPDIVTRHWKQLGYSVRTGAQVGTWVHCN